MIEGVWTSVKLARFVAQRTQSVTPANEPETTFELYSVPSFATGNPEVVRGAEVGSSKQRLAPGDVLICKINPRINRVWVVGRQGDHPQIGSTEWIRFPKHEEVLPKFLAYHLQRESVRSYLAMNASGVGGSLMRVKPTTIASQQMPLPPLHTQRRIVARIDELFSDLDDGEEEVTQARADLATYRRSLLNAAVTGDLTAEWRAMNPSAESGAELLARILADRKDRWSADPRNKGKRYVEPIRPDVTGLPRLPDTWAWATVDLLSDAGKGNVIIGPFGSSLKTSDYRSSGTPLVFVRNIRANNYSGLNPQHISAEKALELKAHHVTAGDILITKMGDPPGDAAIYPSARPDAVITADCIRWRPSKRIDRAFCMHWINSLPGSRWIERVTKGVAQQKINLEMFRQMPVPVAPVCETVAALEILEPTLTSQGGMLAAAAEAETASAVLRQSILASAFRGELT